VFSINKIKLKLIIYCETFFNYWNETFSKLNYIKVNHNSINIKSIIVIICCFNNKIIRRIKIKLQIIKI